jgi:hypothetical protein
MPSWPKDMGIEQKLADATPQATEGTSIDHKSALTPIPLKTGPNCELVQRDCRTTVVAL